MYFFKVSYKLVLEHIVLKPTTPNFPIMVIRNSALKIKCVVGSSVLAVQLILHLTFKLPII